MFQTPNSDMILSLRNEIDELLAENKELKKENQELKDTISDRLGKLEQNFTRFFRDIKDLLGEI